MNTPDSPRRLALRVGVKIMLLLMFAALGYVFVGALRGPAGEDSAIALRIDVAGLAAGAAKRLDWEERPIWVLHRSPEMLGEIARLGAELKRPGVSGAGFDSEYLVVLGFGTELGCPLEFVPWQEVPVDGFRGGFRDQCKGSRYDFAGRVFRDASAPRNLDVFGYRLTGTTLEVFAR